ncbi:MAG: oligosaccharide flippase family protein [Desulfobacterales bacterium]|nr:MAG: oligosaccharide flippase family protein [Desulfobacterales bacterium]
MKKSLSEAGSHLMTGTLNILLAELLFFPTGFITAVFLARKLGPEGYGLFALASWLIIWLEWSSTSLFTNTTIKFVREASDWRPVGNTVIRLYLIFALGISALLWILASPLAHMFHEPVMAKYLKIFAIEIPIFSLARAHRNILVGRGYYKEQARINSSRLIARLALIILFVEMGLSVKGAIMGSIGASVVELIICRLYIRPSLFSRSLFPLRHLWGFGVPLSLSAMSLRIFRLDLVALKALGATAAQAGFYGAALNLSIPPTIVSISLSPPLLSTLSNLLGNGEELKAKEIGRTAMRSVFWLVPFMTMTAGAAPEIVWLIFGEKYLPASPILVLLIFATLGLLMINLAIAILTASGKPGWTFLLTGPLVPLALIGHLILIPWLGGVGAAAVTTSFACLGALASVFAVYRIWRILPPIKTILKSIFCAGIALVLATLWPASGTILVFKLLVIITIILLTFLVLGEFTGNEIAWARSLIRFRSEDRPHS